MNMTEAKPGFTLEQNLLNKAEFFGLNPNFVRELPLGVQQMMNRLDKLGNARLSGKRISMLDETLMSGALIEKNSALIRTATPI